MKKAKYAACHPGKIGDALYSLPFIRYVYGVTGEKIDFFTSNYCEPMRSLFESQPCINSFSIAPNYRIERMDMGCQPAHIPVEGYEHVFQLGFTSVPDRSIHQFIAHCQGVDTGLGIRYDLGLISYDVQQWARQNGGRDKFICIAPRGQTTYTELFNEVAARVPCVIIGGQGDYTGYGYDLTGKSLLETAQILSYSSGFLGLMSSQLVLANGFDIPRIAPHDDKSWDMRHVVYTEYNHYPVNPSADNVLALLKVK